MEKLIILAIAIFLLFPLASAQVWESCPFGEVNDAYPGDCGRYIDTDEDGICDRSQPAPEDRGLNAESQAAGEEELSGQGEDGVQARASPPSLFDQYNFFPITIAVLVLIVLSELLVKDKLVLRYIWNVALLTSFLITAATALLYFLRLDGIHAKLIQLHIEIGLIMVWIGIYHAVRRMTYYVRCVPKGKKKCKEA
ncbi:MAG: hypothetical protein JXB14_01580 [Candidatus Altiarchaeota archaeon]|nr:hypothetical protein [Candidatus Altiarchaeota archaeon]